MADYYALRGAAHRSIRDLLGCHQGVVRRARDLGRAWIRSAVGLFPPERLVILLAFGVMVACVPSWPDGAIGVRWSVISLASLIALYMRAEVHWASVLVLAYAALTLAWSPDRWDGLQLWWQLAALSAVVAIAPRDLTNVFWSAGIGLAINSAIVMAQVDGFDPVGGVLAYSGLFFNRNQQNAVTALVLIGLLSIRDWRAWLLAIVVSIPLLTYPLQRAPILALAAAGAFEACRRWKWLIPAFAVLLAALLMRLASDPTQFRIDAIALRLHTWGAAVQVLTVIGHGLGSFRWAFPAMEFAHNDTLQVAYELGAVGLLGWVILICYNITSGPVVPRLILVAFAVEGLFDFPLYQPAASFMAAMAVGSLVRSRAELRDRGRVGEPLGWLRQVPPRSA